MLNAIASWRPGVKPTNAKPVVSASSNSNAAVLSSVAIVLGAGVAVLMAGG
jgi:hypothetical protein